MTGKATQAERLVALELQVKSITLTQQKYEDHWKEVNGKLDELLSLRNKGIGAFWLASILTGTGIIGVLVSMFDWFRGVTHA